nr:YjcZ family sporulation protein [Bacillus sp. EB600]
MPHYYVFTRSIFISNVSFALIVVLFILLTLVGSPFVLY